MGKSHTIADQEKTNTEFQRYVDKQRADLDGRADAEVEKISKKAVEYYEKFGDDTSLISSNYRHLTTVKEWSLDSINQMITRCQKAIFGGPLPEGAKRDTPKPEITKAIAAMGNLEVLVANAAFDAVQGLLSAVSTKMTTEVSVKEDVKVLAPGLTLFVTVMENSYSNKAFFSNESIVQTFFIFDARFSIAHGNSVSRLQDLQAYEEVKVGLRMQLNKVGAAIGTLDIMDDDYELKFAKFNGILEGLNTRIGEMDAKMAELAKKPKAAMAAMRADAPIALLEATAEMEAISTSAPIALPRTMAERLEDAEIYAKAKSRLLSLIRTR